MSLGTSCLTRSNLPRQAGVGGFAGAANCTDRKKDRRQSFHKLLPRQWQQLLLVFSFVQLVVGVEEGVGQETCCLWDEEAQVSDHAADTRRYSVVSVSRLLYQSARGQVAAIYDMDSQAPRMVVLP